ncbi:MAG: hypothetical protein R2827_07455 [Bdellovibrionales bacterium]
MNRNILVILTVLVLSSNIHARKMDLDGYNTVINKLEKAISLAKDGTVKSNELAKRLGNLYAERARLKFLSEIAKGDSENKGSKNDRVTAIRYYTAAIASTQGHDRLPLILQKGHLQQAIGQSTDARQTYFELLKNAEQLRNQTYIGLAYYGIAEIDFTNGKYKLALEGFNKSLFRIPNDLKPMANYRTAWALLNLGKQEQATQRLIKILKSSDLLEKDGRYNQPFHEDVSRDLITFLSRKPVYQSQINLVVSLCPESLKVENIYNLAVELERTGQWASAILVWNEYLDQKNLDKRRIAEVQIRMAQAYYFLGNKKQSSSQFQSALSAWNKADCDINSCKEIQGRYKNFIVHWEKDARSKNDRLFAQSINDYLKVFDTDAGVFYIAAVQNTKVNNFADAVNLYINAIEKSGSNKKLRNASLNELIETAEASKNNELRRYSYDKYLQLEPKGTKTFEIHYQIAHLDYQEKKYEAAANKFHNLALNNSTPPAIRVKATDLSLDVLALQNNHQLLEERALQYIAFTKVRRTEYIKIARTGCFNLASQRLNDPNTSEEQFKLSSTCLKKYSFADLDDRMKIAYYKVQIALAFKLQDFKEVKRVAINLSRVNTISSKDKDFALSQMLLVYELELDFYQAYKTFKNIENHGLSRADRELKLGMLAELANIPSQDHYEKFIKFTSSRVKANSVRSHLALRSKNPWQRINSDKAKLLYTPELLADTATEAFSKRNDRKSLQNILKYKNVRNSAYGSILNRLILLNDFSKFEKSSSTLKISSANQYLVNKGISQRISLLNEAESIIKHSSRTSDPLYQAYILEYIGNLYESTAKDIKKIPVPKNLSAKEQSQYRASLDDKVDPYLKRSTELRKSQKIFGTIHSF